MIRTLLCGRASALLVPVEGLGLEPPADNGLPPHITVLFPFLPARRVDDAALVDTLGAFPAFDFALTAIGRFPGVLYLTPEPAAPFLALTEACVRRWPDHPPYRGAYAEVIPHLTLAEGAERPGLAAEVERRLPLHARAEEVWVMAPGGDGRWTRRAAVPLSGSPPSRSR
jgi:2'-5' RNA ligase superfamily